MPTPGVRARGGGGQENTFGICWGKVGRNNRVNLHLSPGPPHPHATQPRNTPDTFVGAVPVSHLTVPKYTPAVASKGRARADVTAANAENFLEPSRGSSARRRYKDRELASNGPMLHKENTRDRARA